MTVIQKMYDRASSGIPQTKQTETKAETCMQAVCRFRLLGLTGMFAGVPVFFDFLKEHMFYKAVMSRLEKTAVGVGRRPDKPVKKRQKGAKKRKISLLREKKTEQKGGIRWRQRFLRLRCRRGSGRHAEPL